MAKDYYKILGIEKNATKDDIKKAYKKLAREYHPDRQKEEKDKKVAEEKFKEIAEAYSVLSDDKKRAEYDNPMSGGANFHFDGFDGTDFSDIFSHFGFDGFNPFGGGGRSRQQKVEKGESRRIKLEVSLEDIFNGVTKTLKYTRLDKCPTCGGNGKTANSKEETCPTCHGTGQVYRQMGMWQTIQPCQKCKKGKIITNPCPHCNGSGLVNTSNEIKVDVPKGIFEGAEMILSGYGCASSSPNGVYGDLHIVFLEKQDPRFTRDGDNLIFALEIPIIDALLGCTVDVPTIDGKTLSTKIPQGVEDGTKIKFKGYGMPMYQHANVRGDMVGIVKLKLPKTLTKDETNLLNALKLQPNFKK